MNQSSHESNWDFRSDTVSLPSTQMREAMAAAAVGAEQWGEDPTVNQLLQMTCEITGQEAALFCASGTMANLTAALAHGAGGGFAQEIILSEYAHSFWYEVGSLSTLAGFGLRTLPFREQYLALEDIEAALRPQDIHMAKSSMLWIENTAMLPGGIPIPPEKMRAYYELAREHKLKLHLDGARIFNAAYALGVEVQELTRHCDSVQFCLSKGLGAPFGSILAGNAAFIAEARRCRQALGGGLRQAGIMAAAGLVALEQRAQTIPTSNQLCLYLADQLRAFFGSDLQIAEPQTNILLVSSKLWSAAQLKEWFAQLGVQVSAVPTPTGICLRFVVYPGIRREDIDSLTTHLKNSNARELLHKAAS